MDERSMGVPGGEAPPLPGRQPGPPGLAHLEDPRALTILTTEHWSLLSARSLVYNEAFARAGMFLAFLSATLVALGLVATATGFSDEFLMVAAVILALNLFVGLASLGRIAAASGEDIRYLQGMNRLRHGYHELVPGLERYFVTSKYDDLASVLSFYAPASASLVRGIVHGLTTTPGMVGVICSAVGGALCAVIAVLATRDTATAAIAGGIGFVVGFLALTAIMIARIRKNTMELAAVFPRTDWSDD
jgi:hypothetical protein